MGLGPRDPWCSGHGEGPSQVVLRVLRRRGWSYRASSCSPFRRWPASSSRRSPRQPIWWAAWSAAGWPSCMTSGRSSFGICCRVAGRSPQCGSSGCSAARCGKRTWTETSAAIAPRALLTERARADACRRVGEDSTAVTAVAAVARGFGIGWHTAMACTLQNSPQVRDLRFGRMGRLRPDRGLCPFACST